MFARLFSTRKRTKREVISSDAIHESANNFLNKVQRLLSQHQQANFINTDQSGLEIEMIGNRTISFTNVKITLGKVRSVHNKSCSYTAIYVVIIWSTEGSMCLIFERIKWSYR
jgi:hypothetical protein